MTERNSAPNFFCYAPRPPHADLSVLHRIVLLALKDARGVFRKIGLSARAINGIVHADGVSVQMVDAALSDLRALGLAEEVSPGKWVAP